MVPSEVSHALKRSPASRAARAAVAGSAVSSNPPGGPSPSASSASHTHRASPASFSAAECSSVPPSPRGDNGQRRVELNGGGCANASPRTERIVAAASASPRARETCSAFPISSVEARGRRDGFAFAAAYASSRAPRVHGPPRSARRHFHARAAHARFRSARRDGIEPRDPTSAALPPKSDPESAIASRNVSSSSARKAALRRAWGVTWYSRDSSREPPRRPASTPGFSGGAGARFPPADAQRRQKKARGVPRASRSTHAMCCHAPHRGLSHWTMGAPSSSHAPHSQCTQPADSDSDRDRDRDPERLARDGDDSSESDSSTARDRRRRVDGSRASGSATTKPSRSSSSPPS